jgi:DNA-binding PadR family transcriptional regulator
MRQHNVDGITSKEQRIPSKQEVIILSELVTSQRSWCYGYQITIKTGIGPSTLYPWLKRLYNNKYVDKDSDIFGGKVRFYYRLTEEGLVYAEKRLQLAEMERNIKDAPSGKLLTDST